VLDHVATFDVALLPEVTEYASPLKLLDYFAASRAVLAPDRANLREVVTSGENALLFDPDREGDFDEKLRTLVASPLMREWLGVAGRATIEKLGLTWDHNAQRVVAAFEAAIAARRREVVPR
jgi:glycosyltransferase involved in cell wall biosynthesis